jgi:hypothetical protein
MNPGARINIRAFGISVLVLAAIVACSTYWPPSVEENCWKQEAAGAFQKYGQFRTRPDILRAAYVEEDDGTNPVEVIEKDPNGCSLGSNGQTVLRFFFDDRNELTKIQVFRNYIASDYKMSLIEERSY